MPSRLCHKPAVFSFGTATDALWGVTGSQSRIYNLFVSVPIPTSFPFLFLIQHFDIRNLIDLPFDIAALTEK